MYLIKELVKILQVLAILAGIAMIVILCEFAWWTYAPNTYNDIRKAVIGDDSLTVYQREYMACMRLETLSAGQCSDYAAAQAAKLNPYTGN